VTLMTGIWTVSSRDGVGSGGRPTLTPAHGARPVHQAAASDAADGRRNVAATLVAVHSLTYP